jgi:hypothetical protein
MVWSVTGCHRSASEDNVVARFEGGRLTVEDLAAHYAKMKKEPRFRKNPESFTPEFAFEHAVNMEMIIAKGLKENLHLDPRIRAEIHHFMSDLFLKVMQERLVPQIDKQDFSEEEVRAYFDAHPESYQTPARYDVRIIRADQRQPLEGLREEIEAGALTFDDAARAHSTDERTRDKGGAVGPRPLDRFRPDWRATVADLELGAVSPPTAIGDHWYLFHLAGRAEPVPHDFEEKRAYVRNDLLYARYQEAWQATYARLKKEFDLEVDENRLAAYLKGDDPA